MLLVVFYKFKPEAGWFCKHSEGAHILSVTALQNVVNAQ